MALLVSTTTSWTLLRYKNKASCLHIISIQGNFHQLEIPFFMYLIAPSRPKTWQVVFLKETENAALSFSFRCSTHIRTFGFQKIFTQKWYCSIVATFLNTTPLKIFLILSAHTIRMSANAIRILANNLIVSANNLIKWVRAGRDGISHHIFRWFLRYSWEPKTAKILYGDTVPLILSPRMDTNKANGHEFIFSISHLWALIEKENSCSFASFVKLRGPKALLFAAKT